MDEYNEYQNEALIEDGFYHDIQGLQIDDLDSLEADLEGELNTQFADIELLEEERNSIGNPNSIGTTVLNVVWEQFVNQVGVVAGEDFIKENRGLTFDPREKAHVQDVGDFEKQKYATHNTYVDYQKRGEEYRSNFYTDPNVKPNAKQKQEQRYNEETKVWETYDSVDGEWKKTLKSDYRKPYEEDRNKDKKNKFGSKTVNKDHQVADATIARDAEAGAYMTLDEKVSAANSNDNLYDLDSAANQSKSDHDGEKWAKHKRTGKHGNGETNAEYFGLDEDEYVEQDKKAKQAYEEKKKQKREEEVALGKKSQKEEVFRLGKDAIRSVLMGLLLELVKSIIQKLVAWIRSGEKSFKAFIDQIKEALHHFIYDFKQKILTAGSTLTRTLATAIIGPVINTVSKIWMLIKQGAKSVKDAISYLRDPANKEKPFSEKLLRVGEIAIAGLTATLAIIAGELFEDALLAIPGFSTPIPFLGTIANVLGIFLGAIVSGIAGALMMRLIDKAIAKKQTEENLNSQNKKYNEIIGIQRKLTPVTISKVSQTKEQSVNAIVARHDQAVELFHEKLSTIYHEDENNNESQLNSIDRSLDLLIQEE